MAKKYLPFSFTLTLQTVSFAIQCRVNTEEFAVILEEGTTASVIMVILGRTAKVSRNIQMRNFKYMSTNSYLYYISMFNCYICGAT